MLKTMKALSLKYARLFSVLILLKILLLTSACGPKSPHSKTHSPVCVDNLDLSPALIVWPNGESIKSRQFICSDDTVRYCTIDLDSCFTSH